MRNRENGKIQRWTKSRDSEELAVKE